MMPATLDSEDVLQSLDDALEELQRAAQIPAKQRAVKIFGRVERVCSKAFDAGLSSAQLDVLIDTLTLPTELDQASIGSLIRNLYPAGKVSDNCVIKVVASLGHGQRKVAFPTQVLLLKWLVMVYTVLANPKILSRLYGVLFNLLDTLAIRAPLCHLLSLITRRKHVRPFRIQMLLEVARRSNDASLVGLLRVYKDYYPDVIVGTVTSSRASVFTHPNLEWKHRLVEIQDLHAERAEQESQNRDSFRVIRRGAKRGKGADVPEVHTSRAQESSTTLEEIDTVQSFVAKLEKIELPNQLIAVIGDSLLQKLLQLKSNPAIVRRVDNWLTAFFEDQLQEENGAAALQEMLKAIAEYVRYTKQPPSSCIRYIQALLEDWNGTTSRFEVLEILTWLPLTSFEDLYTTTFEPLETCILDGTTESRLALLQFYTRLLRQWSVNLLAAQPPEFSNTSFTSLFHHVNKLALAILQDPLAQSVTAHGAILTFYETVASLISHTSLQPHVRIVVPHAALVYRLHFSTSLSNVSRLCGILALYKRAFESAMTSSQMPEKHFVEAYPKDYVNHFNGFLMDICNCLWRGRAFNTSDVNALGCMLPITTLQPITLYIASFDNTLAVVSLFSLSLSPTLSLQSIAYLREQEDKLVEDGGDISIRHAGPVTMRSLQQLGKDGGLNLQWPSYRLGVLQYLEAKGVKGVGELMYNTMKHLMTAREAAKT